MSTKAISRPGSFRKKWNTFRTYITKPQNAILLVLGIILTVTTIYPMYTIARDTVRLHPGSIDTQEAAKDYQFDALGSTLTTYNWKNLFTDTITTRVGRERVTRSVGSIYLWTPLLNSILISIFACIGAISTACSLSQTNSVMNFRILLSGLKAIAFLSKSRNFGRSAPSIA